MKVKSKIVARYQDNGKLKAVATVCLDGKFLITGVRVADCQKGLTVFMPSREVSPGEYKDICFPITAELYLQMKDSVLEAYEKSEDHVSEIPGQSEDHVPAVRGQLKTHVLQVHEKPEKMAQK